MYKKYFKTIGLAIIIPIVFLYAFQQGASLAYNYWLSMWADDPIVNGTQIDTDLKLTVFGALGFVQGPFDEILMDKHNKCTVHTQFINVGPWFDQMPLLPVQVLLSLVQLLPSPSVASSPPANCTWTC